MSLSKKLKKSGFWQMAEVVTLMICQFGYFAVMARLLEKGDFGLMAIANALIGFGSIFAEGGMGAALIQHKHVTEKHIVAALQGSMLMGSLVFLILFGLSPYIAVFFGQPELRDVIKVVAVTIVLMSINGVSTGLLQKNFKFKQTSIISIITCVTAYSTGILLGYYGYGVWSLVIATVLYIFLKTIGFLIYAPLKFSLQIHKQEWKDLFSFGSGMILLKISNSIGNGGLNLALGKIFDPATLGVFERTFQLKTLPSKYLGSVLDKIMFPAMAEIQDEEERLFRVYEYGLGISNTLLMPVAVFLIFFSPEIIHIFLGEKWIEAIIPLQIMLAILPFSISSRMADSVVRAKGLIYKNVNRKFKYIVVLLVSVCLGGYYYGLTGAAIAVTGSYLINYMMMIALVKNIFNKSFQEIFYKPLAEAVKLSAVLSLIIIVYKSLFSLWGEVNVVCFIIFSVFLICILAFLFFKKSDLFGSYIQLALRNIIKKKNNKKK